MNAATPYRLLAAIGAATRRNYKLAHRRPLLAGIQAAPAWFPWSGLAVRACALESV